MIATAILALSSLNLLELTEEYLSMVQSISQGSTFSQEVLAPDCRKVLNGTLYTDSRDLFIADLLNVHKTYGSWKIDPVEIIPCSEKNCSILRLMIDLDSVGNYTAMVILRFDENNLVTEINEVLSKVENEYTFKN